MSQLLPCPVCANVFGFDQGRLTSVASSRRQDNKTAKADPITIATIGSTTMR